MNNTDDLLVVQTEYAVPIETVWAALTQLEQLRKWFFTQIPEFNAEVGFHTEFDVKAPSRVFRHMWTLTEVDAPHRITYRWWYDDLPGKAYVTFELVAKSDTVTSCKVINSVVENFPDEYPEFTRESAEGGWNYFINEALKEYLLK